MNINKDWLEDSKLENGNYLNICATCKSTFGGHKRRTHCKECYMNPSTLPPFVKPGAVVRIKENDYKFRIYATDCGNTHHVHGAFFVREAWRVSAIDPERIIGPWIDKPDCSALWALLPPWIKWVAMDSTGVWFGFINKPIMGDTIWTQSSNLDFCTIPTEYHPIYSGDWKDSLVERPQ